MPGADTSGVDVLIGRDRELEQIRQVFVAARSGGPTIALLTGEAGIGKTRLADEAARLARADGMLVLRGEADPSSRRPMQLWRGVYRALGVGAAGDPSLPADERRWEHLETLADALGSGGPAGRAGRPALGGRDRYLGAGAPAPGARRGAGGPAGHRS